MSVKFLTGGALVAMALLVGAVPAMGQENLQEKYAAADRLHDAAMAKSDFYTLEELHEAVHKHGQVAEMRLVSDPRAVECHRFQANLLYMIGDLEAARESLEDAAGVAIINGDLPTVALVYLDAATVAAELGNRRDAVYYARQANMLSQMGFLTSAQRQQVQNRLR